MHQFSCVMRSSRVVGALESTRDVGSMYSVAWSSVCSASPELHKVLERQFCADTGVLRLTEDSPSQWICLANIGSWSYVPELHCIGPCGGKIRCLSPLSSVSLSGIAEDVLKAASDIVPQECSKQSAPVTRTHLFCLWSLRYKLSSFLCFI